MSHLSHQDTVRQGQQLYDNLESAFKIHVQKQKQLAEAQIKASRALFEHHRKQRDKLLNVLRIAVQDKSTSDIFLCKRSFSKLLEKQALARKELLKSHLAEFDRLDSDICNISCSNPGEGDPTNVICLQPWDFCQQDLKEGDDTTSFLQDNFGDSCEDVSLVLHDLLSATNSDDERVSRKAIDWLQNIVEKMGLIHEELRS